MVRKCALLARFGVCDSHNRCCSIADLWGSAVANGDAMKLASMVLEWSHSKPDVALSLFERCVTLLEKDIAHCGDDPGSSLPPVPLQGERVLPFVAVAYASRMLEWALCMCVFVFSDMFLSENAVRGGVHRAMRENAVRCRLSHTKLQTTLVFEANLSCACRGASGRRIAWPTRR